MQVNNHIIKILFVNQYMREIKQERERKRGEARQFNMKGERERGRDKETIFMTIVKEEVSDLLVPFGSISTGTALLPLNVT